jgi:hypothetical protein
MTTKRQVMNALARIDATLDDCGYGMFVIDAPAGKLWHTDTHSITMFWQYELGEPKSDLWRSMLDDIKHGLQDCNGWNDQDESQGVCEICDQNDALPTKGEEL